MVFVSEFEVALTGWASRGWLPLDSHEESGGGEWAGKHEPPAAVSAAFVACRGAHFATIATLSRVLLGGMRAETNDDHWLPRCGGAGRTDPWLKKPS